MRKYLDIPLTLAHTGRCGLLPIFVGASAFWIAIELIQHSFNRSADINDWNADTVGVVIGIGFGLLYRRIRRRQAHSPIDCNLSSFREFRFSSRLKAHQACSAFLRCARASPR